MWFLRSEYCEIVIEGSACRTKIYGGRREIDIADANRPNSYDPVHFVAIIRIPCHFGGACSTAMHHRPRDGYLSIETGRNRGKYTSIYITAGCWLVTLSRTADDSMICRSADCPVSNMTGGGSRGRVNTENASSRRSFGAIGASLH